MATRKVRLTSQRHFGKRLPHHTGRMIDAIVDLAPRIVNMAFRGRSHGKKPTWLAPALDFRFVGHDGEDETNLYFEAPVFGDAIPQQYAQAEIWASRPDANDTGFELLADLLTDFGAKNRDSDRFDRPLLKKFLELSPLFSETLFETMEVESHRTKAIIDPSTIRTVTSFYETTPGPKRVKVYGTLDMIRASTQRFALLMPNGDEAQGILIDDDICNLQGLLNKPVSVFGKAIYRPSGKLLRIDADKVEPGTKADEFFGKIPEGRTSQPVGTNVHPRNEKGGVNAIFGKWPGDETDEQIEEALARMS